MSSIIDRVQALGFLDDLRNRKIRILPEANKIAVMERIDGGKYSLADALGDALGELEDSRPYDAVGLGHPLCK